MVMPESVKVSALERAMNLPILLVRAFAASMLFLWRLCSRKQEEPLFPKVLLMQNPILLSIQM